MTVSPSFGVWLKQQRIALDLTQADLARCAGCSVATIRKIEADERRPSRQVAGLLADCLDIAPEERATFLKIARADLPVERLAKISRVEPAGPPSYPPVQPPPGPPLHPPDLPAPPTLLLGREYELREITHLLQNPACRLLTLVGPGGVGKTRLALEIAATLRPAFADGTYFVSLASVGAVDFIAPTLAEGLGFPLYGSTEPQAQLLHYLRPKKLLLVIDNMEHLLTGVEMLAAIVQQAPGVKLLVTSRERLKLQSEWTFDLGGLLVPPTALAEGVETYSAVALFLQSARRAWSSFELTPADRPAVVRICQLMDGIPLGIELAAAWVRVLSCHEILAEIERSFDFLTATNRDIPARHRSLRAAFDHSWRLLSPEEQRTLKHLCVFRGGFHREAAERVAGTTLPLLSALVDKSLLRPTRLGRYDLHELIRQYAATCLADNPPEQEAVQDRHADFYLKLVQEREPALKSLRQKEVLAELSADIDNIRPAWEWAVVRLKLAELRRAARCLAWFYDLRGGLVEGAAIFDQASQKLLAELEAAPEPALAVAWTLGSVLAYQGWHTLRLGHYHNAQPILKRSITLLRTADDPLALSDALNYLGTTWYMIGNYPEARRLLTESWSYVESLDDPWSRWFCLCELGMVAHAQGAYQEAERFYKDSLAGFRNQGDPRATVFTLGFFSATAQALGKYDEVEPLLRDSLQVAQETGDRMAQGTALHHLGQLACAQGRPDQAHSLLQDSIVLFGEIGDRWSLGRALKDLGETALLAGETAGAQRHFQAAIEIALETKMRPVALAALLGLAQVQVIKEQHQRALELTLFVLNHPATPQADKHRAQQMVAELALPLSPPSLDTLQAQAKMWTFEQVISDVLKT